MPNPRLCSDQLADTSYPSPMRVALRICRQLALIFVVLPATIMLVTLGFAHRSFTSVAYDWLQAASEIGTGHPGEVRIEKCADNAPLSSAQDGGRLLPICRSWHSQVVSVDEASKAAGESIQMLYLWLVCMAAAGLFVFTSSPESYGVRTVSLRIAISSLQRATRWVGRM